MSDRARSKRLGPILLDLSVGRARELVLDVVLMVALSDPPMTYEDIERVARAAATYAELEGISSDRISRRSRELLKDAPHFLKTSPLLAQELRDPRTRRLAIGLAAKIFSADRPIRNEERSLLHVLADAFRVSSSERASLLTPWLALQSEEIEPRRARAAFNAPDRTTSSLFEAMLRAKEATEFRLLVHKLSATRAVLTRLFEGAEIVGLGDRIPIGPYAFRADAILTHKGQQWIVRCLAADESPHTLELSVLSMLTHRLRDGAHVLVAHSGSLSPDDAAFLDSHDPHVVRRERL